MKGHVTDLAPEKSVTRHQSGPPGAPGSSELENIFQALGEELRGPLVNAEDRLMLRTLLENFHRTENNQIEIATLWLGDARPPNNWEAALESWTRLEKKLARNPGQREQYEAVMQKWLERGYARAIPLSPEERAKGFYLTHFPVIREDKATTKLRVVMNGKAEFGGVSLNSCISKGPKLMNDLFLVLL